MSAPEPPGGPLTLHHIGFVVRSIPEALPGFRRLLGVSDTDTEIVHDEIQRVRVAFLHPAGSHPVIELVEPAGQRSPVEALARNGGGIHHLCYEVDDLDAQIAGMRQAGGIRVRSPQPAVAFQGRRIAWMLTVDRLLVELLERGTG